MRSTKRLLTIIWKTMVGGMAVLLFLTGLDYWKSSEPKKVAARIAIAERKKAEYKRAAEWERIQAADEAIRRERESTEYALKLKAKERCAELLKEGKMETETVISDVEYRGWKGEGALFTTQYYHLSSEYGLPAGIEEGLCRESRWRDYPPGVLRLLGLREVESRMK